MSQSGVSILEATRSAPPTQSLDVMLIHCRLPPAFYCIFITHLHSWAEKGTVRIKCIAKQHNAINQP